ncbi:hypothetical protein GLOTRDRAFT_29719 [Gloeophyllum trabeum ATCC 11539]|uniref:Delta 8-(E)-sphingolipid desaturase n=1 Tax=Gloeophyllum trabeum (strain ATCC 11539 / FP-39264 / Madison 617) TaxID=670483 RepID=S7QPD0_GLOTA|nr:uncharacterized protein GLOTRDRAFT_29719 [Gloeophyllum trabeum ATCC 11539]EPQ61426.1 hypothetical protein GLOTRDRAFT_29719 [Gloeophyllum trabeum ATCC 11539]
MGRPVTVWTREQVAARILEGENLVIYRGKLIRIPNSWLTAHPGGSLAILHFVGRDATDEIEAYHYEDTLKSISKYAVGTVEIGEEGWTPLVPPVMVGWVRKVSSDGKLGWHNEAAAIHKTDHTQSAPASQILLVEKTDAVSEKEQAPSLSTISPPPTPLSPKVQARHSAAYKELHARIVDAGLYETPFVTGYGPDFLRYILFATLSAIAYRYNWLTASAFFLGLFWHQLGFFVHDLGHTGVTHNWLWDRLIAILVADYCGGLSIGWWVDVTKMSYPRDPDIQHLPFFACSPAFLDSLYSSYYKHVFPFDAFSRIVIPIQHKIFYVIMSLARFNLYRLSYTFLWKLRNDKRRIRGGRWTWRLEVIGICVFWWWFGHVLMGCGTWKNALWFLLVSNVTASPLHIVLSHYSRSTEDLGLVESFVHRQLRTTTDVICPESVGWIHGGLHLQVTHHLFPRLPRHNLKKASFLVKEFAKEQGLEYAEFGFVEGNAEVRGALRSVAEQVKIIGMVAEGEIREVMEQRKI